MKDELEKFKIDEFLKCELEKITNIYHFYSNKPYNFDSVRDDYIWFSELTDFNDPFEVIVKEGDFDFNTLNKKQFTKFLMCNPFIEIADKDTGNSFNPSKYPENIVCKLVDERFTELATPINNIVMQTIDEKQKNKFQCFTHDIKNNPLQNRLMWSHYSDGLRGFVIEFNFDGLLDSLSKHNPRNFGGYTLMNYTNFGFNDYIKAVIDSKKPLFIDRMLFTKHLDWCYENEVRILCTQNKGFYDATCISRIIIGKKMPQENREELINILDRKGLLSKTHVATFNRDNFTLDVSESLCNKVNQ
ncbi:DUF2971 domain-containing protein [Yersinia enterocolitica]|uniref:DUF2971 domain-containing protein n=1 Tax=Yersinia enterocolitica TaxID=630 RepID=UPI003B576C14|nr:DUF2971 domain-containing protein [Yersinia enterocolitica]